MSSAGTSGSADLGSLLADKSEDETGGLQTTLGITYQQWWAAFKAAELYASGQNFAIGMEIKEDVAVLDSPDAPAKVEFYQIKKHEREGVWTWSELLQPTPRKSGLPEPSTLAKLYSRRHSFSGHPTKLTFVSNLGFKVPLEATPKGKLQHSNACGLHEFVPAKAAEVVQKLSAQLSIPEANVVLTDFHLERTNLPLGGQDTYVTGLLSTLSDTGKLPFKISKPHISARMLASEFQQRSSTTDFANTFQKLKARCLSRADITRVLSEVEAAGPSVQEALEVGLKRLDGENFHYGRHQQIEQEKVRLCADIADRTNMQVKSLCAVFLDLRNELASALEEVATLGGMIEMLVQAARTAHADKLAGLTSGYLYGLALLVMKNAINIDVFLAAPSAEPEAKA